MSSSCSGGVGWGWYCTVLYHPYNGIVSARVSGSPFPFDGAHTYVHTYILYKALHVLARVWCGVVRNVTVLVYCVLSCGWVGDVLVLGCRDRDHGVSLGWIFDFFLRVMRIEVDGWVGVMDVFCGKVGFYCSVMKWFDLGGLVYMI